MQGLGDTAQLTCVSLLLMLLAPLVEVLGETSLLPSYPPLLSLCLSRGSTAALGVLEDSVYALNTLAQGAISHHNFCVFPPEVKGPLPASSAPLGFEKNLPGCLHPCSPLWLDAMLYW